MKKSSFWSFLALGMFLLLFMPMSANAASIRVTIDGVSQSYDQPPVIIKGRTLVPMRGIFEKLGANVSWDGKTQTIIAEKGETLISLKIGSDIAKINGNPFKLDVPPQIIHSRTLVPVRFVIDALGAKVLWDGESQTVKISQTPIGETDGYWKAKWDGLEWFMIFEQVGPNQVEVAQVFPQQTELAQFMKKGTLQVSNQANDKIEVVDVAGNAGNIVIQDADHLLFVIPGAEEVSIPLVKTTKQELSKSWGTKGDTLLFAAATKGNLEVMKTLLAYGVNANAELPTQKGFTVLMFAANRNDTQMTQMLLNSGANPNRVMGGMSILTSAADLGYTKIVDLLLKAKANPNLNESGLTPLVASSKHGYVEIVKLLLKAKADPKIAYQNWTPLRFANYYKHTEIVNLLRQAGAKK